MEIENAVNQAKKELANRFILRIPTADIVLEKNKIKLSFAALYPKNSAMQELVKKECIKPP